VLAIDVKRELRQRCGRLFFAQRCRLRQPGERDKHPLGIEKSHIGEIGMRDAGIDFGGKREPIERTRTLGDEIHAGGII
jgi:hypothetical protein